MYTPYHSASLRPGYPKLLILSSSASSTWNTADDGPSPWVLATDTSDSDVVACSCIQLSQTQNVSLSPPPSSCHFSFFFQTKVTWKGHYSRFYLGSNTACDPFTMYFSYLYLLTTPPSDKYCHRFAQTQMQCRQHDTKISMNKKWL